MPDVIKGSRLIYFLLTLIYFTGQDFSKSVLLCLRIDQYLHEEESQDDKLPLLL